MACAGPEILLARIDQAPGNTTFSEICEQNVVLAGASNLKYCLPHFQQNGMCFVDQCEPGWTASSDKVALLQEKTKRHVADGATAFVFDILGNTAVRFEQYDGSTSLPYKSGGRFHLGGKIVTSPQDIFSKTIEAIMAILLEAKGLPCVILLPLPRYLFARCCDESLNSLCWPATSSFGIGWLEHWCKEVWKTSRLWTPAVQRPAKTQPIYKTG